MAASALRMSLFACMVVVGVPSPCSSQEAKRTPDASAAPPETVIVTGHLPDREQRDKVVWNFVYAHAKYSPKIDQLARWSTPVCPEVRNLAPSFGTFIKKRIEAIATSTGAPTKETCKTNIEIIFTSQPQKLMDGVAKSDPKLLGYHFVHDIAAAATVTRSIQAWYVTATSNRVRTAIDDPYHSAPGGIPGSRLTSGQLSMLDHVLIVVDTDKVAGYSIGPIADYIAMLSLSQAEAPDNCVELPSILDLMSSDCSDSQKPESLTVADKAYLEGLYAMDTEEIGSLQRSAISGHILQSFGDERPLAKQ
jgi:hypothetical protein